MSRLTSWDMLKGQRTRSNNKATWLHVNKGGIYRTSLQGCFPGRFNQSDSRLTQSFLGWEGRRKQKWCRYIGYLCLDLFYLKPLHHLSIISKLFKKMYLRFFFFAMRIPNYLYYNDVSNVGPPEIKYFIKIHYLNPNYNNQ